MKSYSVTIQMKVTEQYFPVVLFTTLNKVVLTSKSVDEILKCDHSNESYWAVLSCGAVYYTEQSGSNFWVSNEILKCDHSSECYWAVLSCGAVYYTEQSGSNFWVSNEILMCDHSNESYWAVLSSGTVCWQYILHFPFWTHKVRICATT